MVAHLQMSDDRREDDMKTNSLLLLLLSLYFILMLGCNGVYNAGASKNVYLIPSFANTGDPTFEPFRIRTIQPLGGNYFIIW